MPLRHSGPWAPSSIHINVKPYYKRFMGSNKLLGFWAYGWYGSFEHTYRPWPIKPRLLLGEASYNTTLHPTLKVL